MSESEIHYSVDEHHIAVITFDLPNRSMNVLTKQGMAEFHTHIHTAINDKNVKGIVITSGKKDFLGGVDLSMLGGLCNPFSRTSQSERASQGHDLILGFHKLLRTLETSGKPAVCAITGTCMGGGFEIALACHYRIVADKPNAQLGLPESKIGLMPGFGGTQRLPRLVGIMGASDALLQGKSYNPDAALKAGFVHKVVPADILLDTAKAWILSATPDDAVQPWDKSGYKIPSGGIYTPAGMQTMGAGCAMTLDKSKGLYLSQEHILSAVYAGLQVSFEQAMEIETEHFVFLMTNPQSFNMIRTLFLSKQALDKGVRRPADIDVNDLKKISVVGAGMMGAGIGYMAVKSGAKLILLDNSQDNANAGKSKIQALLQSDLKKSRITDTEYQKMLDKIIPTTDYDLLKSSDLVIEAVFEDINIKADILKKIETAVGSKCIIATNTSTLPIGDLSEYITYKKNFIGIHFFSPVDKMPLVEIITGKKTGDRAIARAFDFVKKIKKTPILVNDARFFYANRCIIPYISEAHRMVHEGVSPALIENACLMLGFPVGALALTDEVSLDLCRAISESTMLATKKSQDKNGDTDPNPADDVVQKLLAQNRHGKKSGAGFYDYTDNKKSLWTGLSKLYPLKSEQPSLDEIQKRLMTIQTIEAISALEKRVITDIRDADVGAIFGWGYPAYTGGPLSYVDTVGSNIFLRQCEILANKYGKRFNPPKLLREMGRGSERFYVRFGLEI